MKLSEILKGIDVKNAYEDAEVCEVTADSRLVLLQADGSI